MLYITIYIVKFEGRLTSSKGGGGRMPIKFSTSVKSLLFFVSFYI